MTTKKQVEANRQNAKKSTGPTSNEGKQRSSQNALKHGLSAERIVIWDEDPAAFEAFRASIFEYYRPANPYADHLTNSVAGIIWKLRRVPEIEAAIYAHFKHEAERAVQAEALDPEALMAGPYGSEVASPDERALKGKVLVMAERSVTSLMRLAGSFERFLLRAHQELERMKAQQAATTNDSPVIDVQPEVPVPIERPRLKNRLAAKGISRDTPK